MADSKKSSDKFTALIEFNGEIFRVTKSPSIFTNRDGCMDIRVKRRSEFGSMESDGYRYRTVRAFAAESRERIGYCDGALPYDFPLDSIFAENFFNDNAAA